MMPNNIIENCHYFGLLPVGYECYPTSSNYDHYYDSSKKGWVLDVYRQQQHFVCTYVNYEFLVPRKKGGTKKSFFGISIIFRDTWFNDLLILAGFFENMIEHIAKDGVIAVDKNGNNVFVLEHLHEASTYLDDWVLKTNQVVATHAGLAPYIQQLDESIVNAGTKTALFDKEAAPEMIRECLRAFGRVSLSEKQELSRQTEAGQQQTIDRVKTADVKLHLVRKMTLPKKKYLLWVVLVLTICSAVVFVSWLRKPPQATSQVSNKVTVKDFEGVFSGMFIDKKEPFNISFKIAREKNGLLFFEFVSNYSISLGKKLKGNGSVNMKNGLVQFDHNMLDAGKVEKKVAGKSSFLQINSIKGSPWKIIKQ